MHTQRETTLAGLTVALVILAWLGVFLAVYFVPHMAARWSEIGAELSPTQSLLVRVSSLVSHNFFALAPLLLAATAIAVIWRVGLRRSR